MEGHNLVPVCSHDGIPYLVQSTSGDALTYNLSESFDLHDTSICQSVEIQPKNSRIQANNCHVPYSKSNDSMKKQSSTRRILKLMSPTKLLSRNKSTASKEDLDIFENKEAPKDIDLLDDVADSENINLSNVGNYSSGAHNSVVVVGNDHGNPFSNKLGNKPKPLTNHDREKSIEQIMKMIILPTDANNDTTLTTKQNHDKTGSRIFSTQREKQVDMSIGLRLAAKDKLDIMTGHTPIKGEEGNESTPTKKLMIVPDNNIFRKAMQMSTKSPFKKKKDESSQNKKTTAICSSGLSQQPTILRTSEIDPSVHQTTIPSANELLIHARICALLEGYDTLLESRAKAGKRWFSFGDLVGVSRKDLEAMYFGSSSHKSETPPLSEKLSFSPPVLGNPFENLPVDNHSMISSSSSEEELKNVPHARGKSNAPRAMKPHPSTIRSLLECTDDLVVEGYFNETIGNDLDDFDGTSIQVSIFSSQKQRQFIVCYRGTIAQHAKPLRSKATYKLDSSGVNDIFGRSYILDLETKIFDVLQRLTLSNPFCDVTFTGHSFGGGLALIGAVRCAESHQDITVSFHGFGIPKIGQEDFRLRAHSLPNLRIIRVEHAADYFIDLPAEPWEHVGHTITIDYATDKKRTMVNPRWNESDLVVAHAVAYKFGKKKVNNLLNQRVRCAIDSKSKKHQGRLDHEMRNYLHALEHFTHMGSQWVTSFANELGTGIITEGNELRSLV